MRRFFLVPFFAAVLFASEEIDRALREFEEVRPHAFEPGVSARVRPLIEQLGSSGDPRCAGPLASIISASLLEEARIQGQVRVTQKRGAGAKDAEDGLERNIKELGVMEAAGRDDVGPEIERLKEERARHHAAFEKAKLDSEDLDRLMVQARSLRESAVVSCIALIRAAQGDAGDGVARNLRAALDVAVSKEALFLVRILRAWGSGRAAAPLLEILDHPQADRPTVMAAGLAIAPLKDPKGSKALALIWRKDPHDLGRIFREALCAAAGRNFTTPEEAEAWISGLSAQDPAK